MSVTLALRVELPRAERGYRPGDPLAGTIHASALAACVCRDLTVHVLWRTRGFGCVEEVTRSALSLGAHAFAAGEEVALPFTLEVPSGPLSYRGVLFHLEWFVEARAALERTREVREAARFLLLAGVKRRSSEGNYREPPQTAPAPYDLGPRPTPPGLYRKQPASGLAAAGIAGAMSAALVGTFVGGAEKIPVQLLLGGALTGLIALVTAVYRRRVPAPPPALQVVVNPVSLHRGETLALTVRTRLGPGQKLRAQLVATEHCDDGGSEYPEYKHHPCYEQAIPLIESLSTAQPSEEIFLGEVTVPAGAPQTFGAYHNEVRWTVVIELAKDDPLGPEVHSEVHVITILP